MHNMAARTDQIISQLHGERQPAVVVPETHVLHHQQRAEAVREQHIFYTAVDISSRCASFSCSVISFGSLTHLYFILSLQQ